MHDRRMDGGREGGREGMDGWMMEHRWIYGRVKNILYLGERSRNPLGRDEASWSQESWFKPQLCHLLAL